ncbi:hypothetical protein L227DRAFT_605801 [Lentinus tigrinus ALCF2SS1-6]|uniref:Uncharacterized protein n=1 Tax=Lentinus tigrinus ALCF2SS1-6 TaxID=1328759 RepID=A0A5C2STZ1_9APHY|nr:hypothetical protein L227DRAFT_605801 [Lentinus tigrinus ALCF2SS1-6]
MSTTTLHMGPRPDQLSNFSSLTGALESSRGSHAYAGKENRDPRTAHRVPANQPDARSGQLGSAWDRGAVIVFDPTTVSHRGWRFEDIRSGRRMALSNADHPAIWNTRNPGLDLMVNWPGYDHMREIRRISLVKGGRVLTKLDIAREVVDAFELFFEKAHRSGFSGRVDSSWKIGPTPPINDLVLVRLINTDSDPSIFQAVVEIVPRR